MEGYLVLVVFEDGEARRHVKVATCPFNAVADVREELAKSVDIGSIIGIQVDRLGYPYFM